MTELLPGHRIRGHDEPQPGEGPAERLAPGQFRFVGVGVKLHLPHQPATEEHPQQLQTPQQFPHQPVRELHQVERPANPEIEGAGRRRDPFIDTVAVFDHVRQPGVDQVDGPTQPHAPELGEVPKLVGQDAREILEWHPGDQGEPDGQLQAIGQQARDADQPRRGVRLLIDINRMGAGAAEGVTETIDKGEQQGLIAAIERDAGVVASPPTGEQGLEQRDEQPDSDNSRGEIGQHQEDCPAPAGPVRPFAVQQPGVVLEVPHHAPADGGDDGHVQHRQQHHQAGDRQQLERVRRIGRGDFQPFGNRREQFTGRGVTGRRFTGRPLGQPGGGSLEGLGRAAWRWFVLGIGHTPCLLWAPVGPRELRVSNVVETGREPVTTRRSA